MDRQEHNGKVILLQTESFMSVLMGMFFMFVFGFCWSRDTERIKNEKG